MSMNEIIDKIADVVAVTAMAIPLAAWMWDELFGEGGIFRHGGREGQ